MAGSGIGNVVGAVALQDFGTPRVLSMTAKENLSGGVLAFASGTAATVVSSGANSFAATDIEAAKDASGLQFTGIVLQDTASGSPVPVATDGIFILVANGTVTAGQKIVVDVTIQLLILVEVPL